jgi:WD40 repeat protein
MTQHLLIAAATSKYSHLKPEDERPQLVEVLTSVVDLFTATLRRYQRELTEIANNPTAEDLRKELDLWFGDPLRDPSDWIVVYYTGHAEVVGADSLYLLTSDFQPSQYVGTAFSLQQFADLILTERRGGGPRRIRNLLLIMDTCFSGKGTGDLAARLGSVFRKSSDSRFYLLGAALPRQEAQAGALADSLIKAIEELSKRYVMQEWLYFDQVLPAINQRLASRGVQRAVLSSFDAALEEPKFFPNPSFIPTDRLAVPADEAANAISDQEFRDHWGPRSRGVEFDSDPGSYFSGRKAVLSELNAYLAGTTDSKMRIVTGRPGSGKSAILSRLVSASRESSDKGLGTGHGPIDIAVHAKGKSVEDVTSQIASVLQVEPKTDAILTSLRHSSKPLRIVVDALDESSQPYALARNLLRPLDSIDSVRLLVGTRADQIPALGGGHVLDIDTTEYARQEDIAEYVQARLLKSGEPRKGTPYAKKTQLARRTAEIVAANAYPNFLVARFAVENLLSLQTPPTASHVRKLALPNNVRSAFEEYLSRFGKKETLVRDLLLPLAYAEGQGLPWDNIWAALASSISGHDYTDEDIQWLLLNAGAFILEAKENGRSVYRLYHQALADVLQTRQKASDIQRKFVRVLIRSIPQRVDDTGPEWLIANHYVRSHLATHAAKVGRLTSFLHDPLYLLAAEPNRLLSAILQCWKRVPRDIVATYMEGMHVIRDSSPQVSSCQLELIARKRRLDEFADKISSLPLYHPCSVIWAHWLSQAAGRSLARGKSEIFSLEAVMWSSLQVVALVGRADGTVEVWDAASGERKLEWKPSGLTYASHVASVQTQRGDWLAATWSGGHFGVFNTLSGESNVTADVADDERDEDEQVFSVCLFEQKGQVVCATSHRSKRLVLRSVPDLEPLHAEKDAGVIYRLLPIRDGSRLALLAAGDNHRALESLESADPPSQIDARRSILQLRSAEDLSFLWSDTRDAVEHLTDMDEVKVFGRRMFLVFRGHSSHTEIWDWETKKRVFRDNTRAEVSWICGFRESTYWVHVWDGRLSVSKLSLTSKDGSLLLEASEHGKSVNITGSRFTRIYQGYGRPAFMSATVDQVKIWDLEDVLDLAIRGDSVPDDREDAGPVMLNVQYMIGTPGGVVYVASSKTVFAIEGDTGRMLWKQDVDSKEPIVAMSLERDRNWLIAGTHDGNLYIFDLFSPSNQRSVISVGGVLQRVECVRWHDRALAVVTMARNRIWSARIWDLDSGKEVSTNDAYRLHFGEEDKPLLGLAVRSSADEIRVAFASRYGKIMVFSYDGQIPVKRDYPRHYQEWHFPNAGNEYTHSLVCNPEGNLLAGGSEEGHLAIWDFDTGVILASCENAHVGKVSGLLSLTYAEKQVLISGGEDGTIRFWTADLGQMFMLDVGESITSLASFGSDGVLVGAAGGTLAIRLSKHLPDAQSKDRDGFGEAQKVSNSSFQSREHH